MPGIVKSSDIFYACELRRSGKSPNEIIALLGRGKNFVYSLLKFGGASERTIIPAIEVVIPYVDGVSENAIAERFSVARNTIRKILNDHCIDIRGNAEANRQMMLHRSPEEKRRNTEAAHIATK